MQSDPIGVGVHARVWMAGLASTRVTGGVLARSSMDLSPLMGGLGVMSKLITERPRPGLNPYLYVLSNPLKWTDPTGLLDPGEGGGEGPLTCPLIAQVFLGFVPPIFPINPVQLSVWLCVYDCNRTCPGSPENMITEIQWDIPPHTGCHRLIPRPPGK
jgi:hypothetical protein